jgi:acyl-coenzyme A synthetase/AMP-(fatty) acid ligase
MAQDLVAFLHKTSERYGAKTALLMKLCIRYRTWTYEDMWAESGRVASLLQAKGVKPGDRVAIWGPNSPQWVFAFFGSMRAGAIPVPIDLRSDEQFVARIAEKSRPTMGFAPGAGSALGADIVLLEAVGGTDRRDRHQPLHQRALSNGSGTKQPNFAAMDAGASKVTLGYSIGATGDSNFFSGGIAGGPLGPFFAQK